MIFGTISAFLLGEMHLFVPYLFQLAKQGGSHLYAALERLVGKTELPLVHQKMKKSKIHPLIEIVTAEFVQNRRLFN